MVIDKIMALGIKRFGGELSFTQIQKQLYEFETLIGQSLPGQFREFLLHFGNALLFEKYVTFNPLEHSPWDGNDGTQDIEMTYGLIDGLYGVVRNYEIFLGRMPSEMIPIANAPFDNRICLGISGDERGKVYFWDKDDEREITGDRENDFGNVYLIADSFSEFVESLFVAEDEPIDPAKYEDDGESWILEDY